MGVVKSQRVVEGREGRKVVKGCKGRKVLRLGMGETRVETSERKLG